MIIHIPLPLIPDWVIIILGIAAFLHRAYISWKYDFVLITRWENSLYAIALGMVIVFYLGVYFRSFEQQTFIPFSRIIFAWLLVVSLYISSKMVKRAGQKAE